MALWALACVKPARPPAWLGCPAPRGRHHGDWAPVRLWSSRHLLLGSEPFQAALAQLAARLQDRVGDRGDMGIDALQIAQDVEMERARLDRGYLALAQPGEMALGRVPLGEPDIVLLGDELARHLGISRDEDRHRE